MKRGKGRLLFLAMSVGFASLTQLASYADDSSDRYVQDEHGRTILRELVSETLPGEESVSPAMAATLASDLKVDKKVARRLIVLQTAGNTLVEYAREHMSQSFAGAWYDNWQGLGEIRLAFTGDAAKLAQQAAEESGFPRPTTILSVGASSTESELTKLLGRVLSDEDAIQRYGITGGGLRQADGVIEIYVKEPTNSVRDSLRQRFDPRIAVSQGGELVPVHVPTSSTACESNSRDHCNPIRGGMTLHVGDNTSLYCTAGFNAYSGSARYMLTAGHCLDASGGVKRYHSGTALGTVQDYSFAGDPNGRSLPLKADAGIIQVYTSLWDTSRWYYADANSQAWQITSILGSNLATGSITCWSGRKTGWNCRETANGNFSTADGNYTNMLLLKVGNGCADKGDSGGSVVQDSIAVAILTARVLDGSTGSCVGTLASYARNAAAVMGVSITTN